MTDMVKLSKNVFVTVVVTALVTTLTVAIGAGLVWFGYLRSRGIQPQTIAALPVVSESDMPPSVAQAPPVAQAGDIASASEAPPDYCDDLFQRGGQIDN